MPTGSFKWNDDIGSPKQTFHTVTHPLQTGHRRGRHCEDGWTTNHEAMAVSTNTRVKGRIFSFPKPHPWPNDTEFVHLSPVSVRKKKKSRNFTKTIPDLRKLFVAATTRSISSKTKMWKCTFSFTEFPQSNSQTYLQQPLALSPGGTKVTTSRPSVQHSSTNTYWLAQSKQVTFTPQMNLEV